jgi:hypothetical protein
MRNGIVRDELGRVMGSVKDYWNDENESYHDFKEAELVFPRHDQGRVAPVTTWNLNDNKN